MNSIKNSFGTPLGVSMVSTTPLSLGSTSYFRPSLYSVTLWWELEFVFPLVLISTIWTIIDTCVVKNLYSASSLIVKVLLLFVSIQYFLFIFLWWGGVLICMKDQLWPRFYSFIFRFICGSHSEVFFFQLIDSII